MIILSGSIMKFPLLGSLLVLFASCSSPQPDIWGVHDGVKIRPDVTYTELRRKNAIWDGRRITLAAARNEVVSFQVVVESRDKEITDLRVSLPALSHTASQDKIIYSPPSEDPTEYRNRPIHLFVVHSMEVKEPSQAPWIYTDSAPRDPTGVIPVQLVPENARGVSPVKVKKGKNQSLWFDIYVSESLSSGLYMGNVKVQYHGATREIPVELQVFDFTIPHENSLDAMVYYEGSQVELYHGRSLTDRYHRFAHRSRIELTHAYSTESLKENISLFDGSAFSKAAGYEGPGNSHGMRVLPGSFYGVGQEYQELPSAWRTSDKWMEAVKQVAGARTFLYLADEPSPEQYPEIRALGERLRSNPGPGRKLPLLITPGYIEELNEVVDIWLTHPESFDRKKAQEITSWIYNGKRPFTGAVVIESPATDPRSIPWACFKHNIPVYLYWHGVHWEHNFQKVGDRRQNVWKNSITFDNRGQPGKPSEWQGFANGDGVLIYPGEEKLHPEEDRGIKGPIGTIQLANLRRGLQDHLYLSMAKKLGLDQEVKEALDALVPKVFSRPLWGVGFSEDGDMYEVRRRILGEAIEKASSGKKPSLR